MSRFAWSWTSLLLILLLALASAPPCARAEQVVVFGNDYKVPKIYLEDGEPNGILVDILRWAGDRMGVAFDIRLFPWARAYESAVDAEGGIVGLSMTSERRKIFDYSEPIYQDEVIMVVTRGHEFAYSSMTDLRGKRVGIGQSGSFGDAFNQAADQGVFSVDYDVGPVYRLRKLLQGRIDVALISPGRAGFNRVVAQDQELTSRAQEFVVLDTPFLVDPNYLAFAKSLGMTEFLARFDAVVEQGKQNGEIEAIINRHLEAPLP